jgi:hypothetical protein
MKEYEKCEGESQYHFPRTQNGCSAAVPVRSIHHNTRKMPKDQGSSIGTYANDTKKETGVKTPNAKPQNQERKSRQEDS